MRARLEGAKPVRLGVACVWTLGFWAPAGSSTTRLARQNWWRGAITITRRAGGKFAAARLAGRRAGHEGGLDGGQPPPICWQWVEGTPGRAAIFFLAALGSVRARGRCLLASTFPSTGGWSWPGRTRPGVAHLTSGFNLLQHGYPAATRLWRITTGGSS